MKSKTLIYAILIIFTQNGLSQDSLVLSGYLFSKDLNKMLTFSDISINGSKIETDSQGRFEFIGIKGDGYHIDYDYPFHHPEDKIIVLTSDTSIVLGLVMWDTESIKNDTTTLLINHEYGFAPYDESVQNEGRKYGINWEFHGCVVEVDYSYHNEVNNTLLTIRNGERWEQEFWEEVDRLRKLERKRKN